MLGTEELVSCLDKVLKSMSLEAACDMSILLKELAKLELILM